MGYSRCSVDSVDSRSEEPATKRLKQASVQTDSPDTQRQLHEGIVRGLTRQLDHTKWELKVAKEKAEHFFGRTCCLLKAKGELQDHLTEKLQAKEQELGVVEAKYMTLLEAKYTAEAEAASLEAELLQGEIRDCGEEEEHESGVSRLQAWKQFANERIAERDAFLAQLERETRARKEAEFDAMISDAVAQEAEQKIQQLIAAWPEGHAVPRTQTQVRHL